MNLKVGDPCLHLSDAAQRSRGKKALLPGAEPQTLGVNGFSVITWPFEFEVGCGPNSSFPPKPLSFCYHILC